MRALVLALVLAPAAAPSAASAPSAPSAPGTIVVDGEGVHLDEDGARAPVAPGDLAARASGGDALALAPAAPVARVREVVEAFVVAGRGDEAGRALHAALGAPELPPLCGEGVDRGCALLRVHALAHGVLIEGGIGASDVMRACGPVKKKPVLIGRTGKTTRSYAGVTRTGRWDELDALLAEAFAGGGSEVCTTVLLERIDDDVPLSRWAALERAARAAGYRGVTPPPWARAVLAFPRAETSLLPAAAGPAEAEDAPAAEDKKPGLCFGLCPF